MWNDKIKVGVDYYPEQWGRGQLDRDIEIMKAAGVNVVRMGEFAWSKFESVEGIFDFDWLKEAVAKFDKAGIDVILCTPTATPPNWAFYKYPDILKVDKKGERIQIGIRGHRCLKSKTFRRLSQKIIIAMLMNFKDFDNVIGWQIDNELEANVCNCPECKAGFRDFIKEKYGRECGDISFNPSDSFILNKINESYGNDVWSGHFQSFEQINGLVDYPENWLNPAYMLDFYRYASFVTRDYIDFQRKLIEEIMPGVFITTNTWFCEYMADFFEIFRDLDFVSYDNYPSSDVNDLYSHAFHLDLMRGIKDSPFCIMEELSGTVGSWMPMGRSPVPGMLKGYALQAIARGCDMMLHFRFRSSRTGAEMFWHGILESYEGLVENDDLPKELTKLGRKYEEYRDFCREVEILNEKGIAGSRNMASVAIIYEAEDEWAFKIQPQSEDMYYQKMLRYFHEAFLRMGLGVDVINERSVEDFSKYELIVGASLFVENEELVKRLYDYVEKGGSFILCPRSGVKDRFNNKHIRPIPGPFLDLTGARVIDYDSLGKTEGEFKFVDSERTFPLSQWCDILETFGECETIGVYDSHFYRGKTAISRNNYGRGQAYYLGTYLKDEALLEFLKRILGDRDILPEGVEICKRLGENGIFTFHFNDSNERVTYRYEGKSMSLGAFEIKWRFEGKGER